MYCPPNLLARISGLITMNRFFFNLRNKEKFVKFPLVDMNGYIAICDISSSL